MTTSISSRSMHDVLQSPSTIPAALASISDLSPSTKAIMQSASLDNLSSKDTMDGTQSPENGKLLSAHLSLWSSSQDTSPRDNRQPGTSGSDADDSAGTSSFSPSSNVSGDSYHQMCENSPYVDEDNAATESLEIKTPVDLMIDVGKPHYSSSTGNIESVVMSGVAPEVCKMAGNAASIARTVEDLLGDRVMSPWGMLIHLPAVDIPIARYCPCTEDQKAVQNVHTLQVTSAKNKRHKKLMALELSPADDATGGSSNRVIRGSTRNVMCSLCDDVIAVVKWMCQEIVTISTSVTDDHISVKILKPSYVVCHDNSRSVMDKDTHIIDHSTRKAMKPLMDSESVGRVLRSKRKREEFASPLEHCCRDNSTRQNTDVLLDQSFMMSFTGLARMGTRMLEEVIEYVKSSPCPIDESAKTFEEGQANHSSLISMLFQKKSVSSQLRKKQRRLIPRSPLAALAFLFSPPLNSMSEQNPPEEKLFQPEDSTKEIPSAADEEDKVECQAAAVIGAETVAQAARGLARILDDCWREQHSMRCAQKLRCKRNRREQRDEIFNEIKKSRKHGIISLVRNIGRWMDKCVDELETENKETDDKEQSHLCIDALPKHTELDAAIAKIFRNRRRGLLYEQEVHWKDYIKRIKQIPELKLAEVKDHEKVDNFLLQKHSLLMPLTGGLKLCDWVVNSLYQTGPPTSLPFSKLQLTAECGVKKSVSISNLKNDDDGRECANKINVHSSSENSPKRDVSTLQQLRQSPAAGRYYQRAKRAMVWWTGVPLSPMRVPMGEQIPKLDISPYRLFPLPPAPTVQYNGFMSQIPPSSSLECPGCGRIPDAIASSSSSSSSSVSRDHDIDHCCIDPEWTNLSQAEVTAILLVLVRCASSRTASLEQLAKFLPKLLTIGRFGSPDCSTLANSNIICPSYRTNRVVLLHLIQIVESLRSCPSRQGRSNSLDNLQQLLIREQIDTQEPEGVFLARAEEMVTKALSKETL